MKEFSTVHEDFFTRYGFNAALSPSPQEHIHSRYNTCCFRTDDLLLKGWLTALEAENLYRRLDVVKGSFRHSTCRESAELLGRIEYTLDSVVDPNLLAEVEAEYGGEG